MNERKRVVVTGLGAMTPLDETVDGYWDSLLNGKSGIARMTLCDSSGYPCQVAGEVTGFDPSNYMDSKEARRMARFSQLVVAASFNALLDSRIDVAKEDSYRLAVVLGNGIGGLPDTEEQCEVMNKKGGMRVSPFFIPMILPNMAAANVSRLIGLKGYSSTVITACAAGTQGIGEGFEVIRRGIADVVFSGGTEAGITKLALSGFSVIKALTSRNENPEKASSPFDVKRDGFVPAEGAGILILEELQHAKKRDAKIYAEIVGYGVSSDAFHQVQPQNEGQGAARAILTAICDAGIESKDIDYVNAHGTSTPLNDAAETLALKAALGDHAYAVPISSTKSMIGHAMGASGAIEAVAVVKSIQTGKIHPTINLEDPDPGCDLDYVPNHSRICDVNLAITNSFGFGGQNASLIFKKFHD